MKELLELRLGVEVAAAGLAAARMTEGQSTRLIACVDGMDAALTDNDPYRFYAFDVEFHRRLLEGSGNAVIAQLADTIEITLAARGQDTRPGMHHITAESIERHRRLALAIARRDPEAAGQTARMLVLDTLAEFERLLSAQN